MEKLIFLVLVGGMVLLGSWTADAWGNKHCTWHGTAPFCMASCPSGKKKVPGTESKCGPNSIACCVTGQKLVCCPKAWEGNAANAIAIAKT